MPELSEDVPSFYTHLDDALEHSFLLLEKATKQRTSGFHVLQLGTLDDQGHPSVRTIVNREYNREFRSLRFHADKRSDKVKQIQSHPKLCFHGYDRQAKVQLRLFGKAQVHFDGHVHNKAWQNTRAMSRACYRIIPAPGTPLTDPSLGDSPEAQYKDDGFDNFAVITTIIEHIDRLYLSAAGHRRCSFSWNGAEWQKKWVTP